MVNGQDGGTPDFIVRAPARPRLRVNERHSTSGQAASVASASNEARTIALDAAKLNDFLRNFVRGLCLGLAGAGGKPPGCRRQVRSNGSGVGGAANGAEIESDLAAFVAYADILHRPTLDLDALASEPGLRTKYAASTTLTGAAMTHRYPYGFHAGGGRG